MDLKKLTIPELLLLQVDVNNMVEALKEKAKADLDANKPNPYFKLKAGRTSRYISEPALYEKVLKKAFEEQYEDLCTTKSVIALTNAEKLIKKQFDNEDAKEVLAQIQHCTDTKTSAPSLVYSPEEK